jgi:DNA invertase Pin-like site-specific DNA recombinase
MGRIQEQKPPPSHDLMSIAHERGFDDPHIILFEDNGVSGNTPIDKRAGLSSLMEAITNGTIQAVLVSDEARLFRNADAAQLTYFINVCKEHHAIVYTPLATYDFTNATHVNLFRFNCQQAFEMLQEAIMQRTRSKRNGS